MTSSLPLALRRGTAALGLKIHEALTSCLIPAFLPPPPVPVLLLSHGLPVLLTLMGGAA